MDVVNNSKGFLKTMASGEHGLAKTFWLYGFIGGIVWNIVFSISLAISIFLLGLPAIIVFILWTIYVINNIKGVWNSAKTYEGPKVWAILAQIVMILQVIMMVTMVIAILSAGAQLGSSIFSLM